MMDLNTEQFLFFTETISSFLFYPDKIKLKESSFAKLSSIESQRQ